MLAFRLPSQLCPSRGRGTRASRSPRQLTTALAHAGAQRIDAAYTEVINAYARLDLPRLWSGSSHAAATAATSTFGSGQVTGSSQTTCSPSRASAASGTAGSLSGTDNAVFTHFIWSRHLVAGLEARMTRCPLACCVPVTRTAGHDLIPGCRQHACCLVVASALK